MSNYPSGNNTYGAKEATFVSFHEYLRPIPVFFEIPEVGILCNFKRKLELEIAATQMNFNTNIDFSWAYWIKINANGIYS